MGPLHATSATRGHHDKLTRRTHFAFENANLPRVAAFVCYRQATVQMFRTGRLFDAFATAGATRSGRPSAGFVGTAVGRIVGGSFVKLAIKCGAANLQPTRDFRHLPAIMRNREA